MSNKEVSLYVHIPYCRRKCRYCDFASFAGRGDTARAYAKRVVDELLQYKDEGLTARTVFFGGGTPSEVDTDVIKTIVNGIKESFVWAPVEATIECNPCSATLQKLTEYRAMGFDRVSIGVQSFDEAVLKTIGRVHDSRAAMDCIKNARLAGFKNVSIDLMFSIPGQTAEMLTESAELAAELGVDHVSVYSLILEEGTPLTEAVDRGELETVGEDEDRLMYGSVCELLAKKGYKRYEVSNFAKDGFESKHNMAYWQRLDYIGVGSAAHSCYMEERYSNPVTIEGYISSDKVGRHAEDRVSLTDTDILEETVMLGLRTAAGVNVKRLTEKLSDKGQARLTDVINKLVNECLLSCDGDVIRATDKGLDVLNRVILEIVSAF